MRHEPKKKKSTAKSPHKKSQHLFVAVSTTESMGDEVVGIFTSLKAAQKAALTGIPRWDAVATARVQVWLADSRAAPVDHWFYHFNHEEWCNGLTT